MTGADVDHERAVTFDQLALEKSVRLLCKTDVRRAPLTLERVKTWIHQFEGDRERTLAWLILRHLIYRTSPQLESSLRQGLKEAVIYYLRRAGLAGEVDWKAALAGQTPTLSFSCGPPSANSMTSPGKSGEIVTRMVHRGYGLNKWYPHGISKLEANERYLVVDDGTYTAEQLIAFLEGWTLNYADGNVAIVVGLAHQRAVDAIAKRFPTVQLFAGELLTEKNSLRWLSQRWMADDQWPYREETPHETYLHACRRVGLSDNAEGFGSLGLMVAFEHGIPDDSLRLLWDKSRTWTPLIER
ncbi:hypothetical protein DFLDMN_006344 (plasmid) [Cupriavidus sp. H19C3]|uniref:phosphoribosyltransferase-like protein n=1 Tax=Cupriavidus sp. H19C3 TaxID=3241603 RepID=UPI003BF7C8E8